MRHDSVTRLGNSLVQHGPANDRVYLMKLDRADLPGIVDAMRQLGRERGYTKLFAKVPSDAADHFARRGFVNEARVPGMRRGEGSACFMSRYLARRRAVPADPGRIADVLDVAERKSRKPVAAAPGPDVIRLGHDQAGVLAELYGAVFETYPFPITDPDYLREAMDSGVAFFGIPGEGGGLVAAASAEMDMHWKCAEMTDFATLPALRGQGAAGRLLIHMEEAVRFLGVCTAYTIARAVSYGMNTVFARGGYRYGGTLHNNTQIAGRLESMNVWHRRLAG
ncbi:putative beta-lysine N-acetyltransferase [Pseudodesulfovibrio sp. F-1]|uniref:Putative beta-lysine N-acetyltransferase n=1 Tax=Pseudodesulfovibrio alkaliphilus TaxID=2661613 RepID=A0A7K1KR41_9BACT|nr:putative beta-lysine N-acetyltransferase [Pseudodesulfovibrio alkaliphilus]MUM78547.1 putative beta-lysine N-acetyltransferase [Pseudodesulfovibrio alkaliphilus]